MSIGVTKRRIQRLGGSSMIVTIPKSWAKKIGLSVGDEVVVVDEGDHLKIVPPNSKLVKTLGSAGVKLMGYVKSVDPGEMAYCAYTRGFDKLVLEPPKGNGVNPQALVEALERSPYVERAWIDYVTGTVRAELQEQPGVSPKSLKTVGSIVADLLNKAASHELDEEAIEEGLRRAEEVLDALVRNAYKHKVLTCTGENLDPLVLGEMKSALDLFRELIVHIAGDPGAGEVASALERLASTVTGGIANRSGKRILEVIEGVPEAIRRIEESSADPRTKAVAIAFARMIGRIARDSLCPTILSEREE